MAGLDCQIRVTHCADSCASVCADIARRSIATAGCDQGRLSVARRAARNCAHNHNRAATSARLHWRRTASVCSVVSDHLCARRTILRACEENARRARAERRDASHGRILRTCPSRPYIATVALSRPTKVVFSCSQQRCTVMARDSWTCRCARRRAGCGGVAESEVLLSGDHRV